MLALRAEWPAIRSAVFEIGYRLRRSVDRPFPNGSVDLAIRSLDTEGPTPDPGLSCTRTVAARSTEELNANVNSNAN